MRLRTVSASAALAAILLGLAGACGSPAMTHEQTMALRQAQTRSYEVPLDTVFKATMGYLQDNHYQVRQASKENGIINAYKAQDLSGGSQFLGTFFIGSTAKKGDQYDITFTFDAIDAQNTKLRCNITHGTSTVGGVGGSAHPVTDLAAYKSLLDGLSVEVQRRHMTVTMSQPASAQP